MNEQRKDYAPLRKWAKDAAAGKTDKIPYIDITNLISENEQLQAALASQSPKEAMSDAEIEAIAIQSGGRWDGNTWVFEDADMHPFARAIEAASGPNAALVAAVAKMAEGYNYGAAYYNQENYIEGQKELFAAFGYVWDEERGELVKS